ncbi:MAG: Eco57I restriction-modification methylase domain-containing protein [Tannerellaceae bacterium]|jgi:hypothetical protein|nr:Eco57I restriction-modification methylase domain-containing protein [Tannerellaceae bacterium]
MIENFNTQDLILFLSSKLSGFQGEETDYSHYLNETQLQKYSKVCKIGEAILKGCEQIIAIVAETNESLTERGAKKTQYEIAKTILKNEIADLAFFIFYDTDGNFRFSMIHIEKGKDKTPYFSFKRFTYYVSKKQGNRTFKEQIGNAHFGSIDDIIKAFSVEKLNKEFYGAIHNAFYKLIGGEIHIGKNKQILNAVLKLPSVDSSDRRKYKEFAVRLIGRIIFCWFLKYKKSEQGKSLIPSDWLSSENVSNDYYHNLLEKLFFELFNKKMEERNTANLPFQSKSVPFLSGGLFDPQYDDFYKLNIASGESEYIHTLIVPDLWIRELFETLEQYHFTIDENSATDKEISIDPQMLGTIFENLLAEVNPDTEVSARKSTGSFYTPRKIVEYMVEQSIVAYLQTKTGIEENTLSLIIKNYSDDLITQKEKDCILNALYEVKILDPACGAGAFPIGCIHTIVDIFQKLDPDAEQWRDKLLENVKDTTLRMELKEKLNSSNSDYVRKLGVIQHSIYGVDVQELAIEISKLRCFLSLIIDETINDEKENRGVCPLPKLAFNFVVANTLLERKEEYGNLFPFSNESSKWFDPKGMFGVETFDIVIGNPPYVSTRNLDMAVKDIYANLFKLAKGQYDLFTLFIEKTNQLLSDKGVFSFIIPKKLLTNENFLSARQFLLKYLPIKKYVDAQMPFEAAVVETNVIISTRTNTPIIETNIFNGNQIEHTYNVKQDLISSMPFHIFPFSINPDYIEVIDKILHNTNHTLGDFVKIIRGMECGFNHSSISKSKGKNKIIKGEHVEKYHIKNTEWFVTPDFADKKVFKSKDIYTTIPKLVTKFVSNSLDFALDHVGYFNTNVVYNIIPKKGYESYLLYLLALCNSKLLNFWFFNTYVNDDKLFPHIQKNQLESIPIPAISPAEQQPIRLLVEQILSEKKANPAADTCNLEKEIDHLAYGLYELTEKEIGIIENSHT